MSRILIITTGKITQDPELRYLPSGQAVLNFSLAAQEYSFQTKQRETAFFRVSCFGKLAESLVEPLKKGMYVFVDGTLVFDPKTGGPRIYARKTSGEAAASFEIDASTIRFVGKAPTSDGQPGAHTGASGRLVDDDVPF